VAYSTISGSDAGSQTLRPKCYQAIPKFCMTINIQLPSKISGFVAVNDCGAGDHGTVHI
jgi:hypothetical protein